MSNEFEQLDLQEIQAETQRTSKNESFLDQFVPTPKGAGAVTLRILPPLKGRKLYQYNRIHSINGRKVHCPRPLAKNGRWDRSVGCPVCEYYSSLWKQADRLDREDRKQEAETLKDEARQLKPIERYYYNAIIRTAPGKDGVMENVGPKILSVGVTVHRQIMTGITGDENGSGLGNVTDVKNGHDFVLRKELRGEFADYGRSAFVPQPSPMGTTEQINRWKNNLIDLTQLRNPKSLDELEKEIAIYKGIIPDDQEFDLEAIRKKFQPTESDSSTSESPAQEGATPATEHADVPESDDLEIDVEFEATLDEM